MKFGAFSRMAAFVAVAMLALSGCERPSTAPLPIADSASPTLVAATAPLMASAASLAASTAPVIQASNQQLCQWYPADGTVQCQQMWNYSSAFPKFPATHTDPRIVNMALGPYSMCVLLDTGNTTCWGENAANITYGGGDATAVTVSRAAACVITTAGTVKCKGEAQGIYGSALADWTVLYAQSGVDATKGNPIPWTGPALWMVRGGNFHCFQTAGNPDPSTLSCIGSSTAHQHGAQNANDYPTYRFNGTPAPSAASSSYNICVLMREGNVDCLPIYYNDNGYVSGPKQAGIVGATAISGNNGSVCALVAGGNVTCWGSSHDFAVTERFTFPRINSPLRGDGYHVRGRNAVMMAKPEWDLCWLDDVGDARCVRTGAGNLNGVLAKNPKRDETAPVVTHTITGGTPSAAGWYRSDVTVAFSVADPETPVTSSGCTTQTVSATTGTAGVTLTCTATSLGGTTTDVVTIKLDETVPSVTGAVVAGTLGANGWYLDDVTVGWTPSAAGPSGQTLSPECGSTTLTTDSPGRTFTCSVTTGAGISSSTASVTVKRDATTPTIAYVLTGQQGSNQWYVSDVGVTWTTTAGPSGVNGCTSPPATNDGMGITFSCTAVAGNGLRTTVATTPVNRDETKPSISYSGNAGNYMAHQAIIIRCSATDAVSGIASKSCTDIIGDAHTFAVGTNTRSATATDYAGNTNTATASFTVTVSPGSVGMLVDRFVTDPGVANSLRGKLDHGAYDAFRNQINALIGKKISKKDAEILLGLVDKL